MENQIDWTKMPVTLNNSQGDSIAVFPGHLQYAGMLLPLLLERLRNRKTPAVVSIFGGSGCGKTGTSAALAWALCSEGIKTIVIGGDHFPRRIPMYNDAERLSRFRRAGLQALVQKGVYSQSVQTILERLWELDKDADAEMILQYPWLEIYREAGREALVQYLGSPEEQDYEAVNGLISDFYEKRPLWIPCLGRTDASYQYRCVDASQTAVCILEWTHGFSRYISNIDFPIYLDSTPAGTSEARRLRGRDDGTDSPFTALVLEIEQKSISERVPYAAMVLRGNEVIET